MFRRLSILAFFVAALLVAEPLLHSHPLKQTSSGSAVSATCAVCATEVGRLPRITAVAVPRRAVYTVFTAPATTFTVVIVLPLASRAPPSV
jgi:hypothetical protein